MAKYRTFRDDFQSVVRHDRRDLDDRIPLGIEAGHFQIDPNQPAVFVTHEVGPDPTRNDRHSSKRPRRNRAG